MGGKNRPWMAILITSSESALSVAALRAVIFGGFAGNSLTRLRSLILESRRVR
jgi:hypothetical protein